MKKKNKNYLTTVLIALIVSSVAAIAYVIMFHREEATVVKAPPVSKKQADRLKAVIKEKPLPPAKADLSPPPATGKIPKSEPVIIAKAVPPRLPGKEVIIIIDDIGHDMKPLRELLRIDADITFAILPLLSHSREAAETLHKAHREMLMHLPMEPLSYPDDKPGSGALFTDMNESEINFQLEKNLASVPYATGVNNHMGSKFMTDEAKLTPVFKHLKKKDLFFIDSRTTPSSKTNLVADKVHLTVASRRVFLDHERNYDKIYQILLDVADTPAGKSPLIVIGHPYPETIRAIRDAQKVFREKGVLIVPVSKLVKNKTSGGES
jgi:uncharacterized protein